MDPDPCEAQVTASQLYYHTKQHSESLDLVYPVTTTTVQCVGCSPEGPPSCSTPIVITAISERI